jgi:tripartite-type tricarboxylate transporter receptor subunit TctC
MLRVRGRECRLVGLLAAMTLSATACAGGAGQSTADDDGGKSLEGETINFVVSYSTGGGYDTIARAIAPYLEKELGATIVVQNEDGAGGLLAANQVYSAKPDGKTIGFFAGQGIAGASLAGAEGVRFDLEKFSYVGRLSAETRVLVASPKSEHKTLEDVRSGEGVDFGSAGVGAADNLDATVLYPVLDIDGRIVTGFEGSKETGLAITAGDVDLGSGTISSRLSGIKGGDFRPLLVVGDERDDTMPDVPTLAELDLTGENKALAEAHLNLQKMGRMVWAPPGVPEGTLTALQDAFAAASKNPDFLKKMEQADEAVDFTPGDEAKKVAMDVLGAPEQYKALLATAFQDN